MKFLMKMFKALNSAQTPWQVTLAIALGMIAGLTPLAGIHTIVILLVAFVLNIHLGLFFVASAFFAGIGYLFDPWFEQIGYALLSNASLKGLWTSWYNSGLMRMSHFNNTLALGSTVVALLLAIPLYYLLGWVISHYRDALSGVLGKYPRLGLFGILKASTTKDPLLRWWGAGIFVGVAALAIVLALFVIDPATKWALEKGGSKVLQRDVRVGSVDVSLTKGSIAINRLEVSGEQAGIDAFSIDYAAFDIALKALLMNRTHIENIAIKGMGFDTPATLKKKVAAPPKSQESGKTGRGKALPAFELPTPASIMANADLKSLKAYNAAEKELGDIIAKWDKTAKNDFSTEALKDLKQDFAALKELSASKDPQQLLKLKDGVSAFNTKVKAQQTRITSLQEAFNTDRKRIDQLYQHMEQASADDYNNLKSNYTLDGSGGLNVIGLLFGDKIKRYLAQAQHYYALVSPYLASEPKPPVPPRGEGRWMKYPLTGPTPSFWIAKTDIDGVLNKQSFNATLYNISDNQKALGRVMSLIVKSDGPQIRKLLIQGEDNRLGAKTKDWVSFESKGVRLDALALDAVQIDKSLLAFNGNIALTDMSALSGNSTFAFSEAAMTMQGHDKTAKVLGDVLSSINAFKANITLAGTLTEPRIAVSTDLDKQLAKALTAELAKQITAYQQELKGMLAKKMDAQLGSLKGTAGSLVDINALAGEQGKGLNGLTSDAGALLTKGGIGGALKGLRSF